MSRSFVVYSISFFIVISCVACVSTEESIKKSKIKAKGFYGGQVFAKGYDPVSYLTQNKAIKGKESIFLVYKGTKFYFSTEDHKNKFQGY